MWRYLDPLVPMATTYRLNRNLIGIADILLPNSQAEAKYLQRFFLADSTKIHVINNATDLRYAGSSPDNFIETYGMNNFVLCVGKIEPRKNQLKLVQSLSGTDIQLVLIGSSIPQRMDYYNEVLSIVNTNKNMIHIESLPHDSDLLASAYASAKVHVLLGVNETPGIVNLEAGLAGANLVVAECPPVREYLQDFAQYADCTSLQAIKKSILKAMGTESSSALKKHILDNFTWDTTAMRTIDAYKNIL
jgi:glycosyltransferase involved in cell wall biosynthesis